MLDLHCDFSSEIDYGTQTLKGSVEKAELSVSEGVTCIYSGTSFLQESLLKKYTIKN